MWNDNDKTEQSRSWSVWISLDTSWMYFFDRKTFVKWTINKKLWNIYDIHASQCALRPSTQSIPVICSLLSLCNRINWFSLQFLNCLWGFLFKFIVADLREYYKKWGGISVRKRGVKIWIFMEQNCEQFRFAIGEVGLKSHKSVLKN